MTKESVGFFFPFQQENKNPHYRHNIWTYKIYNNTVVLSNKHLKKKQNSLFSNTLRSFNQKRLTVIFSYFCVMYIWTEIASWEWECIIFRKGHTLQGFYPAISRIHLLPVVTIKIQVQHHSLFFYIITASIGNLQKEGRRVKISSLCFFSLQKIKKNSNVLHYNQLLYAWKNNFVRLAPCHYRTVCCKTALCCLSHSSLSTWTYVVS